MTGRLTHERMLDAIEAQAGLVRFALVSVGSSASQDASPDAGSDAGSGAGAGSAAGVDLATPVPACPGWTVHDLVAHVGTANWWGGANVRAAAPDERARGMRGVLESAPPAADGAAALADWYAGLADEMIDTHATADPDTPAWTFAGPGRAGYWLRRMLHETAVHRWDLESALGGPDATTPLPEDVAVDTVDEFCTAMRPVMAALGPALPVTLRLRAVLRAPEGLATGAEPVGATDHGTDLEWVVPGADDAPEAQVTGPPETLALLLWGRVRADADDLEITGDRAALDAALEAGLAT